MLYALVFFAVFFFVIPFIVWFILNMKERKYGKNPNKWPIIWKWWIICWIIMICFVLGGYYASIPKP